MGKQREAPKARARKPSAPPKQLKERVLDVSMSELDEKIVLMGAGLDELKPRTWARRVLVMAAKERIQKEGLTIPTK